ncbi:DUF885 domain-containing protein [Novosphingobium sp.]|uniref:DUF885 domain-containing protein n=1 Tax=Novosphingobium sp. TaxID=1874826 RepID=UPI00286EB426|nr:DUF885 domain-containing protein [Novosphingobium sp.]
MKRSLLAIAVVALVPLTAPAILAAPAAASADAEDARLTAFLDKEFAADLKLRPQLATRLGIKDGIDRWDDTTAAGQLARLQARRASAARMKAAFNRAGLSATGKANYDMWLVELERLEMQYKFRRYQPPFYSTLYSAHAQLPDFLINSHTVKDAADMRGYIARLKGLPKMLDVARVQTVQAQAQGIRVPKFQVERIIGSAKALTSGAPFDGGADSALMADARTKIGKLEADGKVSADEAKALLSDAAAAILAAKPAYDRVGAWAKAALPGAPAGKVGALSLPGGEAWYAAALKLNTTLDLSAAQVHAIGLGEVSRIEAEQDALAQAAGLADRHAFYADRAKKFPPQTYTDELRKAYLDASNAAIARNRELLGARFNLKPIHRIEVIREPAFSEVAGGAAHASGPSPDGTRPGRVYLHLLGETLDPAKTFDLMCHEGVPGHVMQGDIAVRQTGVPKFRTASGYVAYSEGWALYSELLCKEMGAYPDVAADFMRLDAELFRASRLVTDTGLHAMGWSEDQAAAYMTATGRLPAQQARSEVRRYITLPGQATGYKIGMIKIMDLRAKAEKELGARIDIKAFDDLVVGGGSMPLPVLERRVDDWIAAQK